MTSRIQVNTRRYNAALLSLVVTCALGCSASPDAEDVPTSEDQQALTGACSQSGWRFWTQLALVSSTRTSVRYLEFKNVGRDYIAPGEAAVELIDYERPSLCASIVALPDALAPGESRRIPVWFSGYGRLIPATQRARLRLTVMDAMKGGDAFSVSLSILPTVSSSGGGEAGGPTRGAASSAQ